MSVYFIEQGQPARKPKNSTGKTWKKIINKLQKEIVKKQMFLHDRGGSFFDPPGSSRNKCFFMIPRWAMYCLHDQGGSFFWPPLIVKLQQATKRDRQETNVSSWSGGVVFWPPLIVKIWPKVIFASFFRQWQAQKKIGCALVRPVSWKPLPCKK